MYIPAERETSCVVMALVLDLSVSGVCVSEVPNLAQSPEILPLSLRLECRSLLHKEREREL